MAMSNAEADQAWGMLAEVEEEERRTKMVQRYTEMAALPEEERMSQMLMMAAAEYDLSEDKLRTFTVSRLSVWLSLDREVARRVAASYDAVMKKMPGQQAMRRVGVVQTMAREFPAEEQAQLIELIPDVFGGLKEVLTRQHAQEAMAASSASVKKGWWPFWKR